MQTLTSIYVNNVLSYVCLYSDVFVIFVSCAVCHMLAYTAYTHAHTRYTLVVVAGGCRVNWLDESLRFICSPSVEVRSK